MLISTENRLQMTKIIEDEKSGFKTQASSHREDVSLRASPPGSSSVHLLGGLDNSEMDCLEYSFDNRCPDHF